MTSSKKTVNSPSKIKIEMIPVDQKPSLKNHQMRKKNNKRQ